MAQPLGFRCLFQKDQESLILMGRDHGRALPRLLLQNEEDRHLGLEEFTREDRGVLS